MPELDFFLLGTEESRLVAKAIERGLITVPYGPYEAPEYEEIRDVDSFLESRKANRLFFLVSSAYSSSPLEMRRIKKGPNQGLFYIMQRTGGPTIDILFCTVSDRVGVPQIAPGMIGYHKTYWDERRGEDVSAPKAMVDEYNLLKREIKRGSFRLKEKQRTYFVSPETK